MSSTMVECVNCSESFDVGVYEKKKKGALFSPLIGQEEAPWTCSHCGAVIDFADKERPWMGLIVKEKHDYK